MPSVKLTTTLQRALSVLEAFTPAMPRLRLQDVVERTGIPKVSALRFLRTLTELKYVSYDGKARVYALSPKVMSLGYTVLSSIDLRGVALPFLEELSARTDQNVNLAILDDMEIVYIERISRKHILNIDLHVGSRFDLYQTSIGKVILAYMAEPERERIIARLLGDRETARRLGSTGRDFRKMLEEVRKQGYGLNDEDHSKGLRAVGAPVFNHQGMVDGGINIPVFAHLVSGRELVERYAGPLMETAARISAARGFGAPDSCKGGTGI